MAILDSIRNLVKKLTIEEKETVSSYLQVFDQRGKRRENKYLVLYKQILSDPKAKISEEELEHLIYRSQNTAGFKRLLFRLRDKILETLLIDVNVDRPGAYNERIRAMMEIRKSITLAQILQDRGLRDWTALLLEKAIKKGKKYEFYEELLLALRLLLEHNMVSKGEKFTTGILKEYAHYDQCKNAVLKAEVNHAKIIAGVEFSGFAKIKPDWVKSLLDEIRADYKKTGSSQVGFYYFFVETQQHQLLANFKAARKSLLNNLQLLDASPGIYTTMRVGSTLLNLADNDIYLRQFSRSHITVHKALENFKIGSFNYNQGLDLIFYSKFYEGHYETALQSMQTVQQTNPKNSAEYHSGKRKYLSACALFMLKDFQQSFSLLSEINEIENDKEGWNIGIRVLSIMLLIEMKRFDEADAKIKALKAFLYGLDKSAVIERMKLVYKVLLQFTYSGFDYKKVYLKEKPTLELLAGNKGKVEWQIKSPEMILFNQWLFAKAFKQPFVQKIPNSLGTIVRFKKHSNS